MAEGLSTSFRKTAPLTHSNRNNLHIKYVDYRPSRVSGCACETTRFLTARSPTADGTLDGSERPALRRQTVRPMASNGPLSDGRRYARWHRTARSSMADGTPDGIERPALRWQRTARSSTADGTLDGSERPALRRQTVRPMAANGPLSDGRRYDRWQRTARSPTADGMPDGSERPALRRQTARSGTLDGSERSALRRQTVRPMQANGSLSDGRRYARWQRTTRSSTTGSTLLGCRQDALRLQTTRLPR